MPFRSLAKLAAKSLLAARAFGLAGVMISGCQSWQEEDSSALASNVPAPPITPLIGPSHDRDWSPDMAVLPFAEIEEDKVKIHNIRHCTYQSDEEYVVRHFNRTFDLDRIESVDFIVVPFASAPSLAHTMLSFGFKGDNYITVSVEARREKHEKYSAVLGSLRQFEVMYVVADERDVVLRRTKHRGAEVYLYRTRITPDQARTLFVDVMNRVNQIYRQPEFYDSLTNNCTTNIVRHLQQLQPGKVMRYDPRMLLPGYADLLAYELGILEEGKSFAQLREEARITARANRYSEERDFSARIRR